MAGQDILSQDEVDALLGMDDGELGDYAAEGEVREIDLARQQIDVELEFEVIIRQRLAVIGEDEFFHDDLDPPNIPE